MTYILGIDSSCDDTSASVVVNGSRILSNVVSSQAEIHEKYGGIVPELASRRHIEMIWPVVDEALKIASVRLETLSGIAVCQGPGLIGSLLVGSSFAKAVAYVKGIPLIGVNHLEGHIFSVFLLEQRPAFPFLSLIVSGGHTSLIRVGGLGSYRELGRTRDDAAGEAYDKVAKMLGLGYPGGPLIDDLAEKGDPESIPFPRALIPGTYDFSFSGLKTAVRNYIEKVSLNISSERSLMQNVCASFQAAVVDVLIKKAEVAVKKEGIKSVTLTGGVAANRQLWEAMKEMAERAGIELYVPPVALCTDNAAMIAAAGYLHFVKGDISGLELNPRAYLPV
ncbi:MAG TPA: tRNA (adenosine(37)-N6)-threonylcarbamoyltransferase complex transferase subunit TsaD [Nitrospirae bacterium]|nr:tRNA (adenosine(37)-N6)-threonylcarbamoyltransferase complex transferase subunit TsaD [Nitrospirota bacterium]